MLKIRGRIKDSFGSVNCWFVVKVLDKLLKLKQIFISSLIVIGIGSQALQAAEIVDVERDQPLGAIVVDAEGTASYFSLGNGRALKLSSPKGKVLGERTIHDVRMQTKDGTSRRAPVKRRNLKW